MSNKDRRKKDSQDKNKQNQARRKAEANPAIKRKWSAHNISTDEQSPQTGSKGREASSSSPPAARAAASKASKGK